MSEPPRLSSFPPRARPPPASLQPAAQHRSRAPRRRPAVTTVAAPGFGGDWRRTWQRWRASTQLARLNHVFVPSKKADRDRFRNGWLGRALRPLLAGFAAFTREGRALLLLTPMVGCSGIDVILTQIHQLFAMLVALLFVSLLARPFFRTPGLRLQVRVPTRVQAGAPVRFDLAFGNEGRRSHYNLCIEPPFLPWDGRWLEAAAGIPELGRGGHATAKTEAVFVARGEHHIDSFLVGALVPLGLAIGRRTAGEVPRFLVVPRIANVSAITLRHRLPEQRGATVATLRPGETDIAGVRPYRAGDPLKHLHARTWARTGVPHVRTYVDERQDRVALAVVTDGREAAERTKEAALSLAAGVAARLALHEGGLDELLIDETSFAVEPRAGISALNRVLDRLGVHELSRQTASSEEVLTSLLPRCSALVLVTAGVAPRHAALAALARGRGVPCSWAAVAEPTAAPAPLPAGVTLVELHTVESGGALRL